EAGGARKILNDYSFFSAPQLKRDPLGRCTGMMRALFLGILLAVVIGACRGSESAGRNGLDSARAVAIALRLAGPDRAPGFGVLRIVRDTAGYLVEMGPPLVSTNASGDTIGVNVGGRVTVQVQPNGDGRVVYRGQ